MMMNRGYFKVPLKKRFIQLFLPDYIMEFLKSMRKVQYYTCNGGGRDCLKSQTFLSENQEFALARYREMNKFNLEWTFETALEGVSTTATHSKIGFQGTYFIRFFNLSVLIDNYGK